MTTVQNCVAVLLTLFVLSVFGVQGLSNSDDELVFAHILYRHGDRNIISSYPNDPWKYEEYWPEGFGQLTNIGKQQQYELGSYLRNRYNNLIGNNGSYDRNVVYVHSTDVDRTLMSAAYNLAAMFPPKNNQIWNDSLLWQAVPIHTLTEELDYVLAMKKPCPLYEQEYEKYEQSEKIATILKNSSSLMKYLAKHTGKVTINTICEVKSIYQTLWLEQLKNFTLPTWTKKVFYPGSDMEKLANFCFSMPANTKLLARLKAGFFVREVYERFIEKSNGTLSPDRRLWIYSAHDSTIANILNTLGLFEPFHVPPYTSCLFFELHKANGNYHIEIYYKRNRGDDITPLEPLEIPKCGKKCPLSKFYTVYKDIIPKDDFETECMIKKQKKTKDSCRNEKWEFR